MAQLAPVFKPPWIRMGFRGSVLWQDFSDPWYGTGESQKRCDYYKLLP